MQAVLLTGGLDATRFESVLLTGRVPAHEGDMTYFAEAHNVTPLLIKELDREISVWDDMKAFIKILRYICQWQPDIIHTHTAKAGTLGRLAGIIYNGREKIRAGLRGPARRAVLIHTFHGHVFHSYFSPWRTRLFLWIERGLARFTDRIVAISETQLHELSQTYRVAPLTKMVVVPLGFDLSSFLTLPTYGPDQRSALRRSLDLEPCGSWVAIVGRLTRIKNHAMLLRVAERFATKEVTTAESGKGSVNRATTSFATSPAVRFLIVGDGELRRHLEQLVEEFGLKGRVTFWGWRKDLALVYAAADVVVLTSSNEGTPVTLIEAAAAGKPVVSTNVGGVCDVVEEGRSGFLTPAGDVERFYRKLLELLEDPGKRAAFGAYGRAHVARKYSKEALLRNIERVYHEALLQYESGAHQPMV
ncbi:MAG: glycosyltransferase family 4 protein [Acidobacteria bacterium]|nr:glycosyltransferase family 4 protein [Acidobacteriota bacterium]